MKNILMKTSFYTINSDQPTEQIYLKIFNYKQNISLSKETPCRG